MLATLWKRVRTGMVNSVAGLMLGTPLPASAQTTLEQKIESHRQARTITIPLSSTFNKDADSLTAYWSSSQELAGKGFDLLGSYTDTSWRTRTLAAGLNLFVAYELQTATHEFGHVRAVQQQWGQENIFEWNSLDMRRNFRAVENEETAFDYGYQPPPIQMIPVYAMGLNQDELEAASVWRKEQRTVDRALAFLLTKSQPLIYTVFYTPPEEGEPELLANLYHGTRYMAKQLGTEIPYPANDPVGNDGDVAGYLDSVNKQNSLSLSKQTFLLSTALTNFLTWETWNSLAVIGRYIGSGQRYSAQPAVEIGTVKVTPPLLSQYLTTEGLFHTLDVGVKWNNWFSTELSTGFELPGLSSRSRQRLAAKIFMYTPWTRYAYFASYTTGDGGGFSSSGVEGRLYLWKGMLVQISGERNHHDLLENGVKGKENGVTIELMAGWEW